jgi:hypothetical protein
MRKRWIVCGLLVAILSGCTHRNSVQVNEAPPPAAPPPATSIQVNEIAGLATPPGHVTKVVTVLQRGKPIATLRPDAFRIQEEGHPLDSKLVELRLLPPEDAIAFHTVLLLDLGPAATKENRSLLIEAASRFVQVLQSRQSVTVLAFDGSTYIRVVGDFPRNARADTTTISEARLGQSADPSRNLRGAVLDGLNRLDARLKQYGRPIRVGSLVVFSMGPDLANRSPEATMEEQLNQSRNGVYFVGIQKAGSDDAPQALSRSGKELSSDMSHLPEAFENVARRVSADMNRHYVLTYCTPARSGKRTLRVEVDVVDDELKVETGALESQFNASGFSTGCNAAKPPRLSALKATSKN